MPSMHDLATLDASQMREMLARLQAEVQHQRRRPGALDSRSAAVIRIEAIWLAVEPLDMRAGTETALARVVAVFGEARPSNKRMLNADEKLLAITINARFRCSKWQG